jgi:flagellin FlaB
MIILQLDIVEVDSNMNNKAEMGVGTLIIFISLLLVAAVAAGVLIQTSGSLQQRALSTGSQATSQISTNALTLEVSGTDGLNGQVDNFTQLMRLAPGSDPIKLDQVTLSLASKNTSQSFQYVNASVGSTTEFSVNYLQQGDSYQEGVLVRGDVIEINYVGVRQFSSGENLRVNFIPKIGTATLTQFSIPDVVSTQRVYLYP